MVRLVLKVCHVEWIKAIFVDQNFKAIKVIQANLQQLSLTEQAEVYKNNADRALKALNKRDIQFDYIF